MVDGLRLLLVEDDAATLELLSLLLTAEGWTVEAACDGKQALSRLQRGTDPPHAILCDQHLPDFAAKELAEAFRSLLQSRSAPSPTVLLAMSATRNLPDEAGYDGALLKPFACEQVETIYKESLQKLLSGISPGTEPPGKEFATSPPAEAQLPPHLDDEVFRTLRIRMGETALRELYEMALADTELRIERMERAIDLGQESIYRQEAHALKGGSGMVGALRITALAAQAEQEGLPSLRSTYGEGIGNVAGNVAGDNEGEEAKRKGDGKWKRDGESSVNILPRNRQEAANIAALRSATIEIRLMLKELLPL